MNHPINHVAISCTDIEALVDWYKRVLGFELMGEIRHFNRVDHPDAFVHIFPSYPKTLKEVKLALMATGNGVGVEIFQFVDPKPVAPEDDFEFTRCGYFHLCVTDPNPEALALRFEAEGGRRLGTKMDYARSMLHGHYGLYLQDPWGNVIEVMSLSLERVASSGAALRKSASLDAIKSKSRLS